MCFGIVWSGVSFSTLMGACAYILASSGDKRVLAALLFLSVKELIQFINYRHTATCSPVNRALTSLSWIHISFQPFFINLLISAFSDTPQYYTPILYMCLVYAFFNSLRLKEVRGKITLPCADTSPLSSACRKETCSINGKYHLAYGFELESADSTLVPSMFSYYLLTIVPALVIGDYLIVAINSLVMLASFALARHDMGEAAAIWCLNSFWMAALAFWKK